MKQLMTFLIVLFCTMKLFSLEKYTFDIQEIPFSVYGSYLVISADEEDHELYLREVSGKYAWGDDRIFKIEAINESGTKVAFDNYQATPGLLQAHTANGIVQLTIEGYKTLRIRSTEKLSIRLTKKSEDPRMWEWTIPVDQNTYRIHGGFDKYGLVGIQGKVNKLKGERFVKVDGEIAQENDRNQRVWSQFKVDPDKNGVVDIALERYTGGWKKRTYGDFNRCVDYQSESYESFYQRYPTVPNAYLPGLREASYVNWSNVVDKRGVLTRPAMFMSKKLMRHVWSWDNCFNAMALSYGNKDLAWDQIMLFFDKLDDTGAILDFMNDHHVQIDFVKPPIHGWTLRRMMEISDMIDVDRANEIYTPLSQWTNYWFDYLDDDQDGIPQYNHGCNSGWDNSTVFDVGYPVESPELSAYLVLQMDVLSELATSLSKANEAALWNKRADELLALLIKEFWTGEQFRAHRSGDGEFNAKSQSLQNYMPLVLGKRLPVEIREKLLVNFQKSGLITDYGPASEAPQSDLYQEDGYWRGAVWPSSTYLIVDGIRRSGNESLAKELAEKFSKMCLNEGFRENYVATTGKGLRDYGYTWTSSAFILLAHEYLMSNE